MTKIRTVFHMDREHRKALDAISKKTGAPLAELLRRAVEFYLDGEQLVEKLIGSIATRNYENRTPQKMRRYAQDLGLLSSPSPNPRRVRRDIQQVRSRIKKRRGS
jgi:hypothetical protein